MASLVPSPSWAARGAVAFWPIIEQLSSPLAQVVLTPFLLYRLDPHQFGLWVIAQSIILAAPTLSMGRSVALLSVLPSCPEFDRPARTREMTRSVIRLIAILTLVLLFATLVGSHAAAALSWTAQPTTYLVLTVLVLAVIDIETTLTCILKANRRFRDTALIELFARLAQVSLTFFMVDRGASAATVLSVLLATTLFKVFLKWAVFEQAIPASARQEPKEDADGERLRHVGFWTWINVLSGIGFYSFDRWAVGAYLGSAALGSYAVCSQLAQLAHTIPAAAGQVLIPWAATRSGTVAHSPMTLRLRSVAIGAAALASLPALLLIAFGPNILSIWISPAFADQHGLLLRHLAVVFFLLTLNIPFFSLLVGLGQARYIALLTLTASACVVVITLAVSPDTPIEMANLKLIYAGITLWLIVRFFKTVKR